MTRFATAALFAALLVTGCSRDDRYGTREKTGEASREIRHDAQQAKEKIKEGWHETKKEVKEGVNQLKDAANDGARNMKKDARDARDRAADRTNEDSPRRRREP